ncbi:carbohydrate-binding protein [Streptomyces sp. ISL-100]|uniref:carbohydrate-binding protein n=1 Tax=Streptomyces sp. ISL-100 TaxID=2819173 RepID=UPI001BE98FCA|nr:carbohydrate-binding protein [Streptomyces sp. ISL-100]MBT2398469.1 carbohydrate-binding protein [Streptomyces sp. ISL-100]
MTAANNGTSTPEDDDPFGYLYEDGRAAGAVSPRSGGYGYPGPAAQPGVPRTSYHQVGTVGQRQYGQQQSQQQYGQQVPPQQAYGQQAQQGQQNYSQPNAHYAAPETQPGGAPTRQVPYAGGGGDGGRSGGPNTKGLLIGAVAVVAVVVIGIGIALLTSNNKDNKNAQAGDTGGGGSSAGQNVKPSDDPTKKPAKPEVKLPKKDAALLQLSGFSTDTTIPGARSSSGAYVPLNTPGASATWTVKVPKAGAYTLSIDYGVPGKDAKTSLTVNGKPHGGGLNMKNFAYAEEGDWEKGWTNTYAFVNLTKGENTFVISCGEGDQCEANLDRLELKAGHIK